MFSNASYYGPFQGKFIQSNLYKGRTYTEMPYELRLVTFPMAVAQVHPTWESKDICKIKYSREKLEGKIRSGQHPCDLLLP